MICIADNFAFASLSIEVTFTYPELVNNYVHLLAPCKSNKINVLAIRPIPSKCCQVLWEVALFKKPASDALGCSCQHKLELIT